MKVIELIIFIIAIIFTSVVIWSFISLGGLKYKEVTITEIITIPAGKIIETNNGSFFACCIAASKNLSLNNKYNFTYLDYNGNFKLVDVK